MGVKIISTGGTAKALAQAGVAVTSIDTVTGFPEMMDGRVKTLHPKIHGGLLALRDKPEHVEAMRQHGIAPIDLVCVNLYPFEQTVAKPTARSRRPSRTSTSAAPAWSARPPRTTSSSPS